MAEIDELINGIDSIKLLNLNQENNIKKNLGQFYTTNYKKILKDITIEDVLINLENQKIEKIIEPFVGQGDLLNYINIFLEKYKKPIYDDIKIEHYDIDPKVKDTIKRNTLKNPPNYENSLVITNPPYLSRNKSSDKTIFDQYKLNDLYKCFLKSLITGNVLGGMLIIPINFFCCTRKMDQDLRTLFLSKYQIIKMNIFEEAVFDDTDYNVCSFSFYRKDNIEQKILMGSKTLELKQSERYTIGYEVYNTFQYDKFKISRLLESEAKTSNILLKSIDAKNKPLHFEVVNDRDLFYGKVSSRNLATISWNLKFNLDQQRGIVNIINAYINSNRVKYNSLFLSNYRDHNRKRLSFDLAFRLVNTAIGIYMNKNQLKMSDYIS